MISGGMFWLGLDPSGGISPGSFSQIGGHASGQGPLRQRTRPRPNVVQTERGGHNDGGIVRFIRKILVKVIFFIGIGVSGIGYGIAEKRNGGDLAELGDRGG